MLAKEGKNILGIFRDRQNTRKTRSFRQLQLGLRMLPELLLEREFKYQMRVSYMVTYKD